MNAGPFLPRPIPSSVSDVRYPRKNTMPTQAVADPLIKFLPPESRS